MNAKKMAILYWIASLNGAIIKAREYLESGKHVRWRGFRPLLVRKRRDGRQLPSHKD